MSVWEVTEQGCFLLCYRKETCIPIAVRPAAFVEMTMFLTSSRDVRTGLESCVYQEGFTRLGRNSG